MHQSLPGHTPAYLASDIQLIALSFVPRLRRSAHTQQFRQRRVSLPLVLVCGTPCCNTSDRTWTTDISRSRRKDIRLGCNRSWRTVTNCFRALTSTRLLTYCRGVAVGRKRGGSIVKRVKCNVSERWTAKAKVPRPDYWKTLVGSTGGVAAWLSGIASLCVSTKLLYKLTSHRVSTGMGNCVQAGIPSRYVTGRLGQLSVASLWGL